MPGKEREKVILAVSLILFIDQFAKFLVIKNLSLNQSVPVIKNIFHITLVHNYGAAFGILKNKLPLFVFSAIFAVILIYRALKKNEAPRAEARGFLLNEILERPYFIRALKSAVFRPRKYKHKNIYTVALSLILAGALGNLVDRAIFGYVIDFLDFRIWPVFNVADSAITVGAVLLGYIILKPKDKT